MSVKVSERSRIQGKCEFEQWLAWKSIDENVCKLTCKCNYVLIQLNSILRRKAITKVGQISLLFLAYRCCSGMAKLKNARIADNMILGRTPADRRLMRDIMAKSKSNSEQFSPPRKKSKSDNRWGFVQLPYNI